MSEKTFTECFCQKTCRLVLPVLFVDPVHEFGNGEQSVRLFFQCLGDSLRASAGPERPSARGCHDVEKISDVFSACAFRGEERVDVAYLPAGGIDPEPCALRAERRQERFPGIVRNAFAGKRAAERDDRF